MKFLMIRARPRRGDHVRLSGRGLSLLLALALLAGCVLSPVSPTPVSESALITVPSATIAPATSSARPTDEAGVLLARAAREHARLRSARGLIEVEVVDEDTRAAAITTTIDFEYAQPDIHLLARSMGPAEKQSAELILTRQATYVKAGDQWLSTTPGTRPTEVKLLGAEVLPSYLASAERPHITGQREMRGVRCQVISFNLTPEKLKGLQDLAAFKRAARDGVTVDSYKAEVALGIEDGLVRQMSFELAGRDRAGPKQRFVQRVTLTLWDLNASNIAIGAPAPEDLIDLGDFVAPAPTPASAQ